MKLVEILEKDKETSIFLDSSVVCASLGRFLLESYDSHTYDHMSDSLSDDMILDTNDTLDFLRKCKQRVKVFTVPKVIEEIEALQMGIINKQKYLNGREKRTSKKLREEYSRNDDSIEKLSDIGLKVNESLKFARAIQYRNFDRPYKDIVELVRTIESYLVKKKSDEYGEYLTGIKITPKRIEKEKKHADESVMGAAICNSLMNGSGSSIISRDTDFIMLVFACYSLTGAKNVSGNKTFMERLEKNPINLYFPVNYETKNDYKLEISTTELKPKLFEEFKISYLDEKSNERAKKYFEFLLSKINRVIEKKAIVFFPRVLS